MHALIADLLDCDPSPKTRKLLDEAEGLIAAAHLAQEAQRFLHDGTKRSLQVTPTGVVRLA